jgi:hypothetical protein
MAACDRNNALPSAPLPVALRGPAGGSNVSAAARRRRRFDVATFTYVESGASDHVFDPDGGKHPATGSIRPQTASPSFCR